MLNIYFGPPKSLKKTNFIMPRPTQKTNFVKICLHTIILIILVNKMTPCALIKNLFQKLKQRRSERSSLFQICSKYTSICIQHVYLFQIYVYLHTNMSICSKYTSICIQIRLFVPNIRLCAYKYVYLFKVVLIHEKQRRSQMSSLLEMRWKKPFLSLTYERKRNTGTQLKLILVFNR